MKFEHVAGLPELPDLKKITLNNKRHYILPDQTIVPSVTTLLGAFEEEGLRHWRQSVGHAKAQKITEDAAERGETFHTLVEKYLNNTPYLDVIMSDGVTSDLASKLSTTIPALRRINNIQYQETCLHSKKLGLAGRVDLIAEFDNVESIIDFKTARKKKQEQYIQHHFQQATAYGLMYEELTGRKIDQVVVIVAADGLTEPQIFVKKRKDYVIPLLEKIEKYGAIA